MWCTNDRQLRLIDAYNEVSRLMIGGFPEVVSRAKLYRRKNKRNIDDTEKSNNKCQANKDAFDLRTRVTSNLNKLQDEIKTNNYKREVKIVKLGGRQYFERCKDIHYDSKSHTLCVGGREVDFNFHPATNRTQKGKPHPQVTEVIMKKIKAPIIKPSTPEEDKNNKRRDIIEVTFDNKKQVCIIYAKKDSPCPFLKAIHRVAISSNNHKELEELLNKMPSSKFSIDDSGGGRYLKQGFGWQAYIESRDLDGNILPKRPFVMDTLDTTVAAVGYGIVNIIGQILHTTAAAILNYFPLVYHSNQEHKINPLLACPPLQNDRVNWFSNQYAIRQVGLGIANTKPVISRAQHHNGPSIEKQISESCVALHADSGDVSCMHLCCVTHTAVIHQLIH